jgi:hypothetical protein
VQVALTPFNLNLSYCPSDRNVFQIMKLKGVFKNSINDLLNIFFKMLNFIKI